MHHDSNTYSQNTFKTHFTLVTNVAEKLSDVTHVTNRTELSRHSLGGSVACIIQNELGKAATTWNQLLLLLLWYLIPKVVKPPPHILHAGVEAVDGPRFNKNQSSVRSGEKWRFLIQLQISATYVLRAGQVNGVAFQGL